MSGNHLIGSSINKGCFIAFAVFILSICISTDGLAQKPGPDYVLVSDTLYMQGYVETLGDNKIKYQKNKLGESVIYSAEELSEFSDGGQVFESISVDGKPKKLFKRLSHTSIKLLKNGGDYVLVSKDKKIIAINKKNFRQVLSDLSGCGEASLSTVSYSKGSIVYFLKVYDKNKCETRGFEYLKYGVMGGYDMVTYEGKFEGQHGFVDKVGAPSIAFFLDLPLYTNHGLYFTTELHFQQSKPQFYFVGDDISLYTQPTVSIFSVPYGLKKVFHGKAIKPYVKLGGLMAYVMSPETTRYVNEFQNFDATLTTSLEQATGFFLVGLSGAVGTEIPISAKKRIHVDLKYSNSFTPEKYAPMSFKYSSLSIMAGINF